MNRDRSTIEIDRSALDCDRVSCRMLNIDALTRGVALSSLPDWKAMRLSGLRAPSFLAVDFVQL